MNKNQIIRAVRDSLPQEHPDRGQTVTQLAGLWFKAMRSGRGLQLSDSGHSAFIDADIEYADRSIPQWGVYDMVFGMQLQLRIPCPYYIHSGLHPTEGGSGRPQIRLFDLSVVTWLDLHGSVLEYINSRKRVEDFKCDQ